jgi:HAD superfamily hydrolase (TIGR01509 family)
MKEYRCIIFDSDGVLVDSETLSAKVFQEMAMELGFELDFETAVEQFSGNSMKMNLQFIRENIEMTLPENFEKEFRRRTYEVFKTDLKAVPGIVELIRKVRTPFCVASSGPMEKIRLNLELAGLLEYFEGRIFSSYDIGKWKPDPGIFIHAAKEMGCAPEACVVVEDSAAGIRAAVAGGFKVYGLARRQNKELFKQLGAVTFDDMNTLEKLLNL